MSCEHPDCDDRDTREYQDGHGNTLALCGAHYFEAVWPSAPISSVASWDDKRPEGGPLDFLMGDGR